MSARPPHRTSPQSDADRLEHHLARGTFVRIVVPSRTAEGRALKLDKWTAAVLSVALPYSGGAIEHRGFGYWLDDAKTLVAEPIATLDIYLRKRIGRTAAHTIVTRLLGMAAQMKQAALAVAVQQRLYLIRPRLTKVVLSDAQARTQVLSEIAMGSSNDGALWRGRITKVAE